MKRVIIYGLGKRYYENIERISRKYEIVGVTSGIPEEKEKFSNYINLSELSGEEYDYILICSNFEREIINYLIDELGIQKDKILIDYGYYEKNGVFHAQLNEDAIILLLLKSMNLDIKDVTYLELGTNKPIALNNTYCLYRLGAKGILVEPNRELKHYIEITRPRDILINKAVSVDGKNAMFYKFSGSSVSTLAFERLDPQVVEGHESFVLEENYEIETVTINSIFAEMPRVPDVLSIDIEGMDYPVLKQVDYNMYRPKTIIAELAALGSIEQDGEKILGLLKENNYMVIHRNSLNAIFEDVQYKELIQDFLLNNILIYVVIL